MFRSSRWENGFLVSSNTHCYQFQAYEKLSDLKRKRAKANKENQQQESEAEPSPEKVEL